MELAAWLVQFSIHHTLPPLPLRLRQSSARQLTLLETPREGAQPIVILRELFLLVHGKRHPHTLSRPSRRSIKRTEVALQCEGPKGILAWPLPRNVRLSLSALAKKSQRILDIVPS